MICPKCKDNGQKSRISGGSGSSTLMYCPPYYDEEGKYHSHDMNRHSRGYSCSNGHNILVISGNKCPSCDFGGEDEVTVE